MQNDKICSEIISAFARTRSEANLLMEEVDPMSRSLYRVGPMDFKTVLSNGIRAKISNAIEKALEGGNPEELLKNLKKGIYSLSYLGLTIAFEPDMETIGRLNLWVKHNVGEGVALDIKISKKILGGAIVEYKGRVVASTVISRIGNYFLNNNVNI